METRPERLMLLDTASLYFRAFYGVPDSFRAPDGTPVNAVRGLLDFVARLVVARSPTRMVACWDDDWRPQWRVDLIDSYKTARTIPAADGVEDVPDALAPQVPIIAAVLEALGIAVQGTDGAEADDVIGTLTTRSTDPVDIVTGDRDLFQLVDDAREIRILYTASRGVARAEEVTESVVAERFSIPGRAYADYAVLRGDPSDGLPGVKGIGDKTAASLISSFGDLAGVRAAAVDRSSGLSASIRAKLTAGSDYLDVAPRVVAVLRDLDLPEVDDRLRTSPADPEALSQLASRWGLGTPISRLLSVLETV